MNIKSRRKDDSEKSEPKIANHENSYSSLIAFMIVNSKKTRKILPDVNGPDVIRTHDLPVISRAHHRAMLRAQMFA